MIYVIIHEEPRGDSEREYATLEDAKAAFREIEPQAGHRYILLDEDDNILDIKPEIPESASFTGRVRRASNQYAIHVTIPAKIRDELRLMPGDELDVTISRRRGSRERIIIRDAASPVRHIDIVGCPWSSTATGCTAPGLWRSFLLDRPPFPSGGLAGVVLTHSAHPFPPMIRRDPLGVR